MLLQFLKKDSFLHPPDAVLVVSCAMQGRISFATAYLLSKNIQGVDWYYVIWFRLVMPLWVTILSDI